MAELSVIVKCTEKTKGIKEYLEGIRKLFSEADPELIVVNTLDDEAVIGELSEAEAEAPDKVTIVNCEAAVSEGDLFEIGLEYAAGVCFIQLRINEELTEELFDSLVYDQNLISADKFNYLLSKYKYILSSLGTGRFGYQRRNEMVCLSDSGDDAGNIDMHYFFQDIYVAGRVFRSGVKHIFDIGSRIDGYISHLLSMGIKVTMVDIRPLAYKVEGLDFIQGNATELSGIPDGSIEQLSCLHALEHFGLGRYGDPVDADGWKKALAQYGRVLAEGGVLYLSVPVGNIERVQFNAHRIFAPQTIVDEAGDRLRIEEFTVFHNGNRTSYDFSNISDDGRIKEVLEYTRVKQLGPYDCGIFVFRKV